MVRLRGGLGALGLDGLMARTIIWLHFDRTKVHGTQLVFGESRAIEKRPSPSKYPKAPITCLHRPDNGVPPWVSSTLYLDSVVGRRCIVSACGGVRIRSSSILCMDSPSLRMSKVQAMALLCGYEA